MFVKINAGRVYNSDGSLCSYARRNSDWQASTENPFVFPSLIFARQRETFRTFWSVSPGNDLALVQHRARSRFSLGCICSNVVLIIVSNRQRRIRDRIPGNSLAAWSMLGGEKERDRREFLWIRRNSPPIFRRITNFSRVFGILQSARNWCLPTIEVVAYEMSEPESFSFMERSLIK